MVGPQLDGVGTRGLERLIEDVLDPNRNVDPAFRASHVTLEGADERRLHTIELKNLPAGTYTLRLTADDGALGASDSVQVTVQPAPGAIITVKGYATGQFEGYYGAAIAFYELANDVNRFKGFKPQMKRQFVQSLWTFTVEVGVGIHARDRERFRQWRDLSGQPVFTGPLPWDVRAHLERAFQVLGVKPCRRNNNAVVLENVQHVHVASDCMTQLAQPDRQRITVPGNADVDQLPITGVSAGRYRWHSSVHRVEAMALPDEISRGLR